MRLFRSMRGFSLIELSILLAVFGAAAAAALSWLQPSGLDEWQKVELTRQRLGVIERSLQTFRVQQGRLPCAADRSLASTAAEVGQEDCQSAGSSLNVGVVPTRTLGLDIQYMEDGWGRRFSYAVATDVCPISTVAPLNAPLNCTAITYTSGTGNLTVRTHDLLTPNNTTYASGTANTWDNLTTSALYVVISHGPNGDGAWMGSGTQNAVSGTLSAKETENTNLTTDSLFFTDVQRPDFDDLVIYATKAQLDAVTLTTDRYPITKNECHDITKTIGALTVAEAGDMDNLTWDGGDTADVDMLRVLWTMREVCYRYYAQVVGDCNGGTGETLYTKTTPGAKAIGSIVFSANPANSNTITLNGVVWTFVSGAASGNQTQIQGTLASTLTQLVTDLNASTNSSLDDATYSTTSGTALVISHDTPGSGGNAYTLTAGVGTASGATLTGGGNGAENISFCIDCPTGFTWNAGSATCD
jgi:type II secretory pathway pseudopilin PulG